MDISYRIPGTTEPEIMFRRSAFGNLSVLVNGVPAKRKRARGLTYDIPLSDGSTTELQLKGQWTGLKAVVNGVETALEPTLPPYLIFVSLLPLGLVAIGGAIGGVVGAVGTVINAGLMRQSMRLPLKVGAMLGVTVLSAVIWFVVARAFIGAITPIPTLETGTCLNGIREGATITTETTRPVDCTTPHDDEVAGSILYPGGGAFPGAAALQSFGDAGCLQAVRAYVGDDSVLQTLSLILVAPTDETWGRGDREIGCVVLAADGSKLTRTLKAPAK